MENGAGNPELDFVKEKVIIGSKKDSRLDKEINNDKELVECDSGDQLTKEFISIKKENFHANVSYEKVPHTIDNMKIIARDGNLASYSRIY